MDSIVCDSLQSPETSDVFREVDRQWVQPYLASVLSSSSPSPSHHVSTLDVLQSCHNNETLYNIARLSSVYDVTHLQQWRQHYNMDQIEQNLDIRPLRGLQLINADTKRALQFLAKSQLTRLDLARFKDMSEEEIVKMDLRKFVRQLRVLKDDLSRSSGFRSMTTRLSNEVLYLENMMRVAEQVKITVRHLKQTIDILEENMRINVGSMKDNIEVLLNDASSATNILNSEGGDILRQLTVSHVRDTLDLVDTFVETVIIGFNKDVGFCQPLSNSFNASVVALCDEMVQPFNGFWASIGW